MALEYFNYELLSEYPLYYLNGNGEVEVIQNTYSYENIIKLYKGDLTPETASEYKITGDITIIPEMGAVFFAKEVDAIRFKSLFATEEGRQILIENYEQSMRNAHKDDFYKGHLNCPNGIYSFREYDSFIYDNSPLMELRYIDDEATIRKVKIIEDHDKNLKRVIANYLSDKHIDFAPTGIERLLFDVLCENGKIYIDCFYIKESMCKSGPPLLKTMLNCYLMFSSKVDAGFYRYNRKNGMSEAYHLFDITNIRINGVIEKKQELQNRKDNAKLLAEGLVDIIKPFVDLDTLINFSKTKILPIFKKKK